MDSSKKVEVLWVLVIALTLALGFSAGSPALAQLQDPSMSGEVNKDTVHVNEDLLPKQRTWDLIDEPWIDPGYLSPQVTGELNK